MSEFVIIITHAPYGQEKPFTALRFVQASFQHKVNIFLVEDGVFVAKKGQQADLRVEDMLKDAIKSGVSVKLCGSCAKARGLSQASILFKHCFRNSLVPLLNVLGVQIGILLGGIIVVEYVFNFPGLGLLTIYAVLQRDFPLIQGIVILFASAFVFINIIVDLLCSYVDRRIEF